MRTPAASVAHLGQSLHNLALSHNITLLSVIISPPVWFVQLSEFIGDWFEARLELTPPAGGGKGFQ